jgi:negative regulator of sigma E activity
MNPDPVYQRLREIGWRRKLKDAEQAELRAWLAAHPEAETEVASDTALNEALGRLPQASVPSNFTARVMQAIEREAAAERPPQVTAWWWRRFVPRLATAMVVLLAGVLFYRHSEVQKREELAEGLALVAGAAPLSDVTVLEDFDAIRSMTIETAAADEGLLAMSADLLALHK